MKAIDTLKNHIRDLEKMVLVFDEYAMHKTKDETKKAIQELTEAIEELEDLETKDRLAELEKVILDYYLAKGYRVGVGDWTFKVEINSRFRSKSLSVLFGDECGWYPAFTTSAIKTKEIFDKAFEYFKSKN